MFTWICPQCGREVPPAYNECSDCTGKQAGTSAPPQQGQPQQGQAAIVNLRVRTANSDEEAVGTFSFKIASLGPYETKEMIVLLNTKLRVYELPDWQNLVPEIQITSPQ